MKEIFCLFFFHNVSPHISGGVMMILSGIVFPSLWLFCRLSFTTPYFVESGHRVWPTLTVPLFHHLIEGRGFLGSARLCLVEWVQINMNIHEPIPSLSFPNSASTLGRSTWRDSCCRPKRASVHRETEIWTGREEEVWTSVARD